MTLEFSILCFLCVILPVNMFCADSLLSKSPLSQEKKQFLKLRYVNYFAILLTSLVSTFLND